MRSPLRDHVNENELVATLDLYRRVQDGDLISVIAKTVIQEANQNIQRVRQETQSGIEEILSVASSEHLTKLMNLSTIFEINQLDHDTVLDNYTRVAEAKVLSWLSKCLVLEESDLVKERARIREQDHRAPWSRRSGNGKDSLILETCLEFARSNQSQIAGLKQEYHFVSSNIRDLSCLDK